MAAGRHEQAEALLLLLLVALEQSCLDQGRWSMAWLMTHMPEPPWQLMAQTPSSDPLRPFGRLAEPAWTAAAMAFTKDAAALAEIRRRGPLDRESVEVDRPERPKGGGKGGGKEAKGAAAAQQEKPGA